MYCDGNGVILFPNFEFRTNDYNRAQNYARGLQLSNLVQYQCTLVFNPRSFAEGKSHGLA